MGIGPCPKNCLVEGAQQYRVQSIAFFGSIQGQVQDPLAIEFAGQVVSLRLAEAESLIVDVAADCPIQRPRPS